MNSPRSTSTATRIASYRVTENYGARGDYKINVEGCDHHQGNPAGRLVPAESFIKKGYEVHGVIRRTSGFATDILGIRKPFGG